MKIKTRKSKLLALMLSLCMAVSMFAMNVLTVSAESVDVYSGAVVGGVYETTKDKLDKAHYIDVSELSTGKVISDVAISDVWDFTFYNEILIKINNNTISMTLSEKPDMDTVGEVDNARIKLTFDDATTSEFDVDIHMADSPVYFAQFPDGEITNGSKIEANVGIDEEFTLNDGSYIIPEADLVDFAINSSNEAVATVKTEGDDVIVTPVAPGSAIIYAEKEAYDVYNYTYIYFTLVVEDTTETDGKTDKTISFNDFFDNFDMMYINDQKVVDQNNGLNYTSEDDKDKKYISGYPGFSGNVGEYTQGSTIVTIYKDFIKFMQEQSATQIKVTFENRNDTHAQGSNTDIIIPLRALQNYTVSFDANGGTGTMADVVLNEQPGDVGVGYKIPASKFTAPEGKQFDKWVIYEQGDKNHIEDQFAVGEDVIVEFDIELSATWKDIPTVSVPDSKPDTENPKTGNTSNVAMYSIFALIALFSASAVVYKKRASK